MAQRTNLIREFLGFLRESKAWWLAPILVVIALLTALLAISAVTGGAAAPFIYTLF